MLSEKIAHKVTRADFDQFEAAYKDPTVAELLPRCSSVVRVMAKFATAAARPGIEKVASAQRLDVLQVRPTRYGYLVKWAAAPDGVQPQEQELSAPQAQQALPPEVLQAADQQGVGTVTNVAEIGRASCRERV